MGFEPTGDLRRRRFSRPVLSTTQPPLQASNLFENFPVFHSHDFRLCDRSCDRSYTRGLLWPFRQAPRGFNKPIIIFLDVAAETLCRSYARASLSRPRSICPASNPSGSPLCDGSYASASPDNRRLGWLASSYCGEFHTGCACDCDETATESRGAVLAHRAESARAAHGRGRPCHRPAATYTRCNFSTTRDAGRESLFPNRRHSAGVTGQRSHAIPVMLIAMMAGWAHAGRCATMSANCISLTIPFRGAGSSSLRICGTRPLETSPVHFLF